MWDFEKSRDVISSDIHMLNLYDTLVQPLVVGNNTVSKKMKKKIEMQKKNFCNLEIREVWCSWRGLILPILTSLVHINNNVVVIGYVIPLINMNTHP